MPLIDPSLALGKAGSPPPGTSRIHEVARQLEGQFAQMLIKCMRDASFGDSLFPGENQTFRDMHDQQLAMAMSQGKGLGLAPMIARQLGETDPDTDPVAAAVPDPRALGEYRRMQPGLASRDMLDDIAGRSGAQDRQCAVTAPVDTQAMRFALDLPPDDATVPSDKMCGVPEQVTAADPEQFASSTPERFVAEIWGHAKEAARELGVDPRALVAQAALETGWGKRGIRREDGASSHNLFGIKATGWSGERARVGTHEYTDGVKHSETADFRAYSSPAESFADYVRLLKTSPRYEQALAAGTDIQGFARGLQKAGYATDPSYAAKIAAIANGPTLGKVLKAIAPAVQQAANAVVSSVVESVPAADLLSGLGKTLFRH